MSVIITPKVTRREGRAWESTNGGWTMEVTGDLNDGGRFISVLRMSGARIDPDSIKKIDDERWEFTIKMTDAV